MNAVCAADVPAVWTPGGALLVGEAALDQPVA